LSFYVRYFDANISPISRNYCNDENGEKSPECGRFKLLPKAAPLKVVILPILVKIANLDGKMAKEHQRAGNSNWMQKVAPWRVAKKEKMAILAKVKNLAQGLAISRMWQIS